MCFLTATSNNNVTHTVIVRPKFSNVYNMSYAQVKYSDEESEYVSGRTTVIVCLFYTTRWAILVLQDIFEYSSTMSLQENMFHMW